MYTDEQLQDMRWTFTRALEAIRRELDASDGEKDKLWPIYEDIDQERSKFSKVVWEIPHESLYNKPYTDAYNAVDEAAQYISYAMGDDLDARPGYIARTRELLTTGVEALAYA